MAALANAIGHQSQLEASRRDLLTYCQWIDPKYQTPRHIVYLAGLLDKVDRGEISKLAISLGPRFGKSRLVSHYCSFWLHREEDRHLLLISAGQKLSERNSKWIRADVMSEKYPWNVAISDDSSSVLNWTTTGGASVRALSTGSTVTGFQANMAIIDDAQPDMMTPATRDSLEEWLRGVLETRLEPNAPMILINSRWSTDDLFARYEQGEDAEAWTFVNLEAVAETLPDVLGRQAGESLWPERWTEDLLAKKKLAVGTHVWESQYQGHPTVEGGRLIKVSDLKSFDILPSAPEPRYDPSQRFYDDPLAAAHADLGFVKIAGIDTSGVSTTGQGSYNAMVSLLYDHNRGDIYVFDVLRTRGIGFDALQRQVMMRIQALGIDFCVIENSMQGGRLYQALKGIVRCPMQLVEARDSKEARLIAVEPYISGGKVAVKSKATWREAFMKELGDFPAGKYSDQTDAFVWALSYVRRVQSMRRGNDLFDQQLKMLDNWMAR